MDGVTPEQVGPLLATNQIVLYELAQEGGDLESVFLSLTSRARVRRRWRRHGPAIARTAADGAMINALRAELLKMRTMPGVWVTFGLAFPLTVLGILIVLASAGGLPGAHLLLRAHRSASGAGSWAPASSA